MKAKDLRNSILQMAVEGKLVPQDPNDEPASALLERIQAERAKLIKEKKIKAPKGGESVIYRGSDGSRYEKRGKGESLCVDDEIPFDIPDSWEWARLDGLCSSILVPQRDKPRSFAGNIPWCRIEDIEGATIDRSLTGKCVDEKTVKDMNLKVNPVGTVLCSNSATIGVPAVVLRPLVTNQRFIGFVCGPALFNWYLYLLFLANHNYLCGVGTGTTQSYIARATFEKMLVPLPPLAEQRRIVARVEKLMPLIDEYGSLEDEREDLDKGLPDALRKSVLQQAVEGKLVEQDPSDEPATALLSHIRSERRELASQGKLRLPRGGESVIFTGPDGLHYEKRVDGRGRESEPVCIDDEIPFDIPESWEWTSLGSVISLISGVDLATSKFNDKHEGVPYLTGASNFNHGSLIENRWTKSPTRISHKGELLFTCKGTVGEMAVNSFDEAHIARQIMAIVPNEHEMLPYIQLFLSAMVYQIKSNARGVIPGIERSTILNSLMPCPPLAEQQRISDRVHELFNLID